MDTQDIRTLKILEEIDQDQAPSQRDLANKLNISLGLVNSFIKRLVNKGYFKISTIPRNRVRYILTPKGMAEKTRLTYEFVQYSFQFYKDARGRLKRTLKQLEIDGIRRIVFYGAGDLAEIAYLSIQETDMDMVAILDPKRIGRRFFGLTIEAPEALYHLDCDCVLITSIDAQEAVKTDLEHRFGNECNVIPRS